MTNLQPAPSRRTDLAQSPPPRTDVTQELRTKFDQFLGSLGEVLLDFTALEVNTMVVSQITGMKFVPEEAYCNIYEIPQDLKNDPGQYFQRRGIPNDVELRQRYVALRKKLNMEFQQVSHRSEPCDQRLELPDPKDPTLSEQQRLQDLLQDGRFLRGLRKLSELRAAIDGGNARTADVDVIYAQTILQLDGDVINRYHEKLFTHEQKDLLLNIHRQGVTTGEQQWHGLLDFMVKLVQHILMPRGSANITLLPGDGRKQNP